MSNDLLQLEAEDLRAGAHIRARRAEDHYAVEIAISTREGEQQHLTLRFETRDGMMQFLRVVRQQARAASKCAAHLTRLPTSGAVAVPPLPSYALPGSYR